MHERFSDRQRLWLVATLFLVSMLSYADRNVLSVVIEGIKRDFALSDTMVGLLIGAPFSILFALSGIFVARLADLHSRKVVLIVCLLVWSVATILCGISGGVWMLVIARMLVGVGEAGTAPASHSLAADYCPPEQRSRAYAALTASAAVGGFVALTAGGLVAGRYGWRAAFLGMALLSLPVLVLACLVLVEPRAATIVRRGEHPAKTDLLRQVRALAAKRSYVLIVFGVTLYGFVAYGPLLLAPAYMIRVLRVDVAQVGLTFGPALGAGTLIGSLLGGLLGDRLSRRDARWLVRLPGLGLLASTPIGLLAFRANDSATFIVACTLLVGVLSACLPILFAALQAVCGPGRRALATALLFGSLNMIAMTFGPLLTGSLSDIFSQTQGVQGFRSALLASIWLLIPAGLIVIAAGRWLIDEVES
ncbi:Sugar phosphate permease [Sphingomonas palmae]|uniref:Sugar phosphate permease n=1 Tax=Sphingomonas palmae TaxID=1855283 RepID=A0A1H7M4W8_9SPHN|nr:Sugar phosphate permease [Sphingomonas palmae]